MKCNYIQDMKVCDYFDLFKLRPNYEVDTNLLDQKYKVLQKQFHPDLFSSKTTEEQKVSLKSSTAVNQAYQTLKNPVHRAMYILSRNNINIFDEGESYHDPKLMVPPLLLEQLFNRHANLDGDIRAERAGGGDRRYRGGRGDGRESEDGYPRHRVRPPEELRGQ